VPYFSNSFQNVFAVFSYERSENINNTCQKPVQLWVTWHTDKTWHQINASSFDWGTRSIGSTRTAAAAKY